MGAVGGSWTVLSSCLACGGQRLKNYLDLGEQPLANSFCKEEEELPSYPLSVNFCRECFHSQLTISVDPHLLFANYLYVSGTTNTLRDYFEWLSLRLLETFPIGSKVLDLASNDGSFLKVAKSKGFQVLGVDPAANLMDSALRNGVPTICDFWPGGTAEFFTEDFDAIVAMNVFAHVANPLAFLKAARNALKPGGRIYIQTSQAKMFMNGEFDTIYHEHLSFFSARSMQRIAIRAGLQIKRGEYVPVHGTSYLWTLSSIDSGTSLEPVSLLENLEESSGMYKEEKYLEFGEAARNVVAETRKIVEDYSRRGYAVWGYGAAAKGNTFINFAGIDMEGIIDDNPLKQGLVSPGGRVKVYSIEIVKDLPNKVLFIIPAWNLIDEITLRLKEKGLMGSVLTLTYFPKIQVRQIEGF